MRPIIMASAVSSGRSTPNKAISGRSTPTDVNFKSDCVNIYIITDDKSKQNGASFEAQQVDDKFREILQKRKGKTYSCAVIFP